ncbi:MAG: hypothetical protein SGILL_003983 [Bacillariaceae sp.]
MSVACSHLVISSRMSLFIAASLRLQLWWGCSFLLWMSNLCWLMQCCSPLLEVLGLLGKFTVLRHRNRFFWDLPWLIWTFGISRFSYLSVKEGKGVDINVQAFLYASMANAAAALKGKLGSSVTKALKSNPEKNMDAANVYAVMNIISFCCSVPFVVVQELPTLDVEWNKAVEEHGLQPLLTNIIVSGFMFYIYNEFAFAFTAQVGAVTSSVLNTAKRVIIIVVSAVVFQEPMERNTVIGSAIAIGGTFGYSLASKKKPAAKKDKKA